MGTIRRQSIQSTLLFVLGIALAFLLRLVVFPKYLTTDELGLLTVMLDAANLFAAFIPLGAKRIIVRYLPYYENKTAGYENLISLIAGLTIIGLIAFLILFGIFYKDITLYYSERAPLLSGVVFLIVPLTIARVIYSISAFYALAQKRNVFSNFLSEILIRLLTVIIVMVYAYSAFSITGLGLLYVGAYFLIAFWMLAYSLRGSKISFHPKKVHPQNSVTKPIITFGILSALVSGTTIITKNIDSLMITSLMDLSSAGIYTIPFFIGMLIEVPKRAIGQITAPFIAESLAREEHSKIEVLYKKTSLNQLIIGSITLLCVWISIDDLFSLIPNGEVYAAGKYVVLIIGLSKIIDMATGSNREIIQNSQYYRTNLYLMLLLGAATILLNYLLIPNYGIEGAAITQVIIVTILNSTNSIIVKMKYGFSPFSIKTVYVPVMIALIYLLSLFLPATDYAILNITLNSTVAISLFTVMLLVTKTSEDVNLLFTQIRKRLKV